MTAERRISQRYTAHVAVLACSTIDSRQAVIVDISRHGAKVQIERPYASGESIALELSGDRLSASVTWVEIDRMGVRFDVPLGGGAFAEALNTAARDQSFRRGPAGGSGAIFGRRVL